MTHSKHLNVLALAVCVACISPTPALAAGGHQGWCIGVGNPHHNSGCTGGSGSNNGHQTNSQPAQVTQTHGGTKPPAQTPTPQTVTVPVVVQPPDQGPSSVTVTSATTMVVPTLPGGTTVDKQNPAKPSAQTQAPAIVLQPTVVAQPPDQGPSSVTATSPAIVVMPTLPGGTTVDKQNPTGPAAHHAPATSTLQVTSVAQPSAQGPSSVMRPPAITVVTQNPGAVIQVNPVTTLSRPRPTANPVIGQVPVLAPAIPTQRPPQPIATPQPQQPTQVAVPLLQPPLPTQQAPQPVATPQPQQPVQVATPLMTPPLPTQQVPQPVATPQPQRPVQVATPLMTPPLPTQQAPQPIATPQPQQPTQVAVPLLQPPIHGVMNPPLQVTTVNPPQPPVVVTQLHSPVLVALNQPTQQVTTVSPPLPSGVVMQPHPLGQVAVNQPTQQVTTLNTARPPLGDQVAQQLALTAGGVSPQMPLVTWVVSSPGRQPSHDLPFRVSMETTPRTTHCLASGFGWRREQLPDGTWRLAGAHPDLRTTDALVRDIPADHHLHSGCVVEVVRRELARK